MKSTENTEKLIDSLASDLSKVSVMRHPLYCVLPWAICAVAYVVLGLYFIGVRPDIVAKIWQPLFSFEIVLVLWISAGAAISSAWLRVPDMRGATWLNTMTLTLFAVFVVMCVVRTVVEIPFTPDFHFAHQCHKLSVLFGILPAIIVLFVSMRGRTTRPVLMAFMNTLSIGGMSYVAMRIVCHADDMGHLCIYHILPYLFLGFVAAIVGRRIYRW